MVFPQHKETPVATNKVSQARRVLAACLLDMTFGTQEIIEKGHLP